MQQDKTVIEKTSAATSAKAACSKKTEALEPWQLAVTVPDDALEPVLSAGEKVIVDCSDGELIDGSLVALRQGKALEFWVYREGFSGVGCRLGGRSMATLGVLGGTFRYRGPIDRNRIRLVGRVLEPNGDAKSMANLGVLDTQRRRLLSLRDTTRKALTSSAQTADLEVWWEGATTIEAVAERLEAHLADRAFADRFALEQRLDTIDSRLALLDEMMADARPTGLADAMIQLEALWQMQPAALAEDDLEVRLLGSALGALRRVAHDRARATGAVAEAATPGNGESRGQPLELVASPRARRR